jgi:hypothetical protein
MRKDKKQCSWRDAFDSRSLQNRFGARPRELLFQLIGKSGDAGIIELVRDALRFLPPEVFDFLRLPIRILVVADRSALSARARVSRNS